jgi:hypothetical protein
MLPFRSRAELTVTLGDMHPSVLYAELAQSYTISQRLQLKQQLRSLQGA